MKFPIRSEDDERKLTTEDMVRARIPRGFWSATREAIPNTNAPYKTDILKYIKNLDEHIRNGNGLYLYGDYATGKTSAAIVCAKACIARGGRALFMTGMEVKTALIDKPPFDESSTLDQRLAEVELLIIDDPEQAGDTKWNRMALEDVLRRRFNNTLSTIIATNYTDVQFKDVFGEGPMSVILRSCVPVRVSGVDWLSGMQRGINDRFNA